MEPIKDAFHRLLRFGHAAKERALPRTQTEPIASRLNEAIDRAFVRAAVHTELAATALSAARATARALADIQETPLESRLSKNAETA